MFNEEGGIWVTHSVPGFPYSSTVFDAAGWVWPKTKFSQHFHCVTLTLAGVEAVSAGLTRNYVLPQEKSHHVPAELRALYPITATLDVELGVPYNARNGTGVEQVFTKGGVEMTVLSKEGSKDHKIDLWEDLVAPAIESDLLVETWCRGPNRGKDFTIDKCEGQLAQCGESGCICEAAGQNAVKEEAVYVCQKSTEGKYSVTQIEKMNYGEGNDVLSINSHSKWALAEDAAVVCFGDINRQATQRTRGGGAVCMQSETHWNIMRKMVAQTDVA